MIDLQQIRSDLQTRNVIRFAQETRYGVNCIRTAHNQRVVILTINGKVIAETVFNGPERLPAHKEVYRLRKVFGCEYEE